MTEQRRLRASGAVRTWPLLCAIFAIGALAIAALWVDLGKEAEDSTDAVPLSETLFLTWQRDPCTTMTARWLTRQDTPTSPLRYRRVGDDGWQRSASPERWGFGTSKLEVASVELTGLEPGTEYVVDDPGGQPLTFRTAPARLDGAPIVFVSGGDASASPATSRSNVLGAAREPLFAVLGGDLAYADGKDMRLWLLFLRMWHEQLVTPSGRTVPLLVCIGNHEVQGGTGSWPASAPFFASLFRGLFDERSYAVLDLADHTSLLLLDTAHTTPVEGAQTEWLDETLAARADVEHLIVFQHVPGFPSHRPLDGDVNQAIRRHWHPLFERHGVDVVFEHHEHTYKRTHLLRGGQPNPQGVLYLGDGCWGVQPRPVLRAAAHPWLAHTASTNHVIVTELRAGGRQHEIFDGVGALIDTWPSPRVQVAKGLPQLEGRFVLPAQPGAQILIDLDTRPLGSGWSHLQGDLELHDDKATYGTTGLQVLPETPRSLHALRLETGAPGLYQLSLTGGLELHPAPPLTDRTPSRPLARRGFAELELYSADPLRGDPITQRTPGLIASVYDGAWGELPDFAELPVRRVTPVPTPRIDVAERDRHYGIVFEGFLRVEKADLHQLTLLSDDGSRLFLGGELVVDNDGRHPLTEETRTVALDRGDHPLRLEYFQDRGAGALVLQIATPRRAREPVRASELFH